MAGPLFWGGLGGPPPGLGDIAYSLTLKAQVAARGLVTCMAPKGRPEAGGCQGATTPAQLLLPSLYLGQMIRFCLSRRPPVRLDPGHMVRVSVCPLCSLPAGRVPAALRGSRAVAMVTRRGASGAGGASESWKGPAQVCVCVREGVRAHLAPRRGWLPSQGCLPTEEPMKDLPWREKKRSLEPSRALGATCPMAALSRRAHRGCSLQLGRQGACGTIVAVW